MADRRQLSRGSSGTDVKELQTYLNNSGNGYNLSTDGIFGAKTQAAVRDYQKRNGLTVDGIVGKNTWGALTKVSKANTQSQQTAVPTATVPEKLYRYDAENDPVYQAAVQKVTDTQNARPAIRGTFDEQVRELFDKMQNQEKFSYDLNGDALYQQYKNQYTTQGKLAMMDTMGQAAALTGGYGNSYAQGVGQQAYQGYLQQLNDRVPELYQLALQKYYNDQALLQDQFNAARQMQADEYTRDRDTINDWYNDLSIAKDDENTAYERGNSSWYLENQLKTQDEQTAYDRQQDAYDKLTTLIVGAGYTPTEEELAAAGITKQQATALAKQYSNAHTASDSGDSDINNGSVDKKDIIAMQKELGVTEDGLWGPKSQSAAKEKWGVSSADEAYQRFTFAGFGPEEWQGYFAHIRKTEGQAAAEADFQLIYSKGWIPQNMLRYAAIGASGNVNMWGW